MVKALRAAARAATARSAEPASEELVLQLTGHLQKGRGHHGLTRVGVGQMRAASLRQRCPPDTGREVFTVVTAPTQLHQHVARLGARKRILVDLKTGQLLWDGAARAQDGGNSNQGSLAAMLVTAVVKQIAGTVSDKGFKVAALTSNTLLSAGRDRGLLWEPRSPEFGKEAKQP